MPTSPHRPVAHLTGGGPLDDEYRHCPLVAGFLPTAFEPEPGGGEYVLWRTVTHQDGSLCGGVYRWAVAT